MASVLTLPRGARLGCGSHQVYLTNLGGTQRLAPLGFSSLSYGRRLDEMTAARIDLTVAQDASCLPYLSILEPFTHEISIYRDDVEVWAGPITEPIFRYDSATLDARDIFQYFERRILPFTRTFVAQDLALIATRYIEDALSIDTSPNISISTAPCGVIGTRAVADFEYRRAADEIRELARTGLDFTALARTIRFGGATIATNPLPTLTESIFEVAEVRLAGLQMANDVFVFGSSTVGVTTPTVGRAGGFDLPVIQQTYQEPSILDVLSADDAARTRLDFLRTAPVYISGRLDEDAPVAFSSLVPGAVAPVRQQVGFRSVNTTGRLMEVAVSVTKSESGEEENVRLTIEPIGTEA